MQREKKLVSNIMIFALGNLGSKFLQFLLVPFYTAVLAPSEYGVVDILQTGSMLLIPIFSLTISESVFRYGMDKSCNKKSVFSIGFFVSLIGSAVLIVLGSVGEKIFHLEYQGFYLMLLYSVVSMMRNVTSQFLRAIGKVKLFSIDNMLQTLAIVLLNLLLLIKFRMGISGYMWGYIWGNIVSVLFALSVGKLWKYLEFRKPDIDTAKQMLLFSIPLVPNTICWWISSSTDRLMLVTMVGESSNGIYSIAHKIPSVINIVIGIFIQAWQISANEEFDKKDKGQFYSAIFDYLVFLSFSICSLLMLFAKVEIRILSNANYYEAWESMIVLILGMVFFTFAQFLGTIYTANKKTMMAFWTNLLAAIVNVILNMVFVPRWGAVGAAFTTCFSYFVLWISRIITTKSIVEITIKVKKVVFCSMLLCIQTILQLLEVKFWILFSSICAVGIIALNYKQIYELLTKGIQLVKAKCNTLSYKKR